MDIKEIENIILNRMRKNTTLTLFGKSAYIQIENLFARIKFENCSSFNTPVIYDVSKGYESSRDLADCSIDLFLLLNENINKMINNLGGVPQDTGTKCSMVVDIERIRSHILFRYSTPLRMKKTKCVLCFEDCKFTFKSSSKLLENSIFYATKDRTDTTIDCEINTFDLYNCLNVLSGLKATKAKVSLASFNSIYITGVDTEVENIFTIQGND